MSEGFEKVDALQFAAWGADMLKIDACAREEPSDVVMAKWRDAINATGRKILISNCHNGCETDDGLLPSYCRATANMWRSSRDISSHWDSVMYNLDTLKSRGANGQPGGWNDPDFLEVNIGEFKDDGTQTLLDMNQAHFALWAITSSPLILGFDMNTVPSRILNLVQNPVAIRINQAYHGNAGDVIPGAFAEGVFLPSRPHPVLAACNSSDPAQHWTANQTFKGSICSTPSKTCWNIQDCQQPVILYQEDGTGGCGGGDGQNQKFFLRTDGTLRSKLRPQDCVEPTGSDQHLVLDKCTGKGQYSWSSSTLQWTEAGKETLCVSAATVNPPTASVEVWQKPLNTSEWAVSVFNRQSTTESVTFAFEHIPGATK